jgi:hypothetical protein
MQRMMSAPSAAASKLRRGAMRSRRPRHRGLRHRSPRAPTEAEADTFPINADGNTVEVDSASGFGARLAPEGAYSATMINKKSAARGAHNQMRGRQVL